MTVSDESTPLTSGVTDQIAALDAALAALDAVRSGASSDKRFGFDDPWDLFIRKMRMLTPQAYGTRLQNRLAEHFGWEVIGSKLDKGDVLDARGKYHEVKVTLITASNKVANFVQIRPHQQVAGYHLFVICADYTPVHFWLSKAQMDAELGLLGGSAHGTKTANTGLGNREYAIRFEWDLTSATVQRWLRTYARPTPRLG